MPLLHEKEIHFYPENERKGSPYSIYKKVAFVSRELTWSPLSVLISFFAFFSAHFGANEKQTSKWISLSRVSLPLLNVTSRSQGFLLWWCGFFSEGVNKLKSFFVWRGMWEFCCDWKEILWDGRICLSKLKISRNIFLILVKRSFV